MVRSYECRVHGWKYVCQRPILTTRLRWRRPSAGNWRFTGGCEEDDAASFPSSSSSRPSELIMFPIGPIFLSASAPGIWLILIFSRPDGAAGLCGGIWSEIDALRISRCRLRRAVHDERLDACARGPSGGGLPPTSGCNKFAMVSRRDCSAQRV